MFITCLPLFTPEHDDLTAMLFLVRRDAGMERRDKIDLYGSSALTIAVILTTLQFKIPYSTSLLGNIVLGSNLEVCFNILRISTLSRVGYRESESQLKLL